MRWIFIIFLLLNYYAYSQIDENFDVGIPLNERGWVGDVDKFIINSNGELQLNAEPVTSNAQLFIDNHSIVNALWEINVQLHFNPSSQNYCKILLATNGCNMDAITEGYYVKIGGSDDEVSLYRIRSGGDILLIDGTDGILSNDKNYLSVKVSNINNNWKLETKTDSDWIIEGYAEDQVDFESNYFGIYCVYTSSRSKAFYFDDMIVTGDPFLDSIPPEIISFNIINDNSLFITCSEVIDSLSIDEHDFVITPDDILVESVKVTGNEIIINFNNDLSNKTHYQIIAQNLSDLSGNTITDTTIFFDWIVPERFDIIFSEFMNDPDPVIDLPECEYIEINNKTDFKIDLYNYKLICNEKEYIIQKALIQPYSYLVLLPESKLELWEDTIPIAGLEKFPSLSKTNGELVLKSSENTILDAIRYNDEWAEGTFKDDGGWSFEIIDPDNRSGHHSNWVYSTHQSGGTPGSKNSVSHHNPDIDSPFIKFLTVSDSSIQLFFSEPVMTEISTSDIGIEPDGTFQIDQIEMDKLFLDDLSINLSESLSENQIYTLVFKTQIQDFAGNKLVDYFPLKFGGINDLDSNNVIINEILFNPVAGGVDFIELYNRSDKVIRLSDLYLAEVGSEIPIKIMKLSEYDIPFLPDSYWIVTPDKDALNDIHALKSQYYSLEPNGFPSMPDDEGYIAITNLRGELIDQVHYFDDWHYPLLNSKEGVSLEKIHPDLNSLTQDSWHSASQNCGFSTPGYINSQFQRVTEKQSATLTVSPKLFTPNMDGNDDFLNIGISSDKTEGAVRLIVYSSSGREIKTIANNQLVGTDNHFTWDGTTSTGELASPGIYIIWMQLFYLDGQIIETKKACVVGL